MPDVYRHVPFEDDWMQNPVNETLYNQLGREHKARAPEQRLLAQVADATAYVVGEELFTREALGEDFFVYKNHVEPDLPPYAELLSQTLITAHATERLLRGYHGRAVDAPDFFRVTRDFRRYIDSVGPFSRLSAAERTAFLETATGFSQAQIQEVGRYGTVVVVIVNDKAWHANIRAKDESGVGVIGVLRRTAHGPLLLTPSEHARSIDFVGTLEHEYGHAVDSSLFVNTTHQQKQDLILWELKSEAIALLSESQWITLPWQRLIRSYGEIPQLGYGHLTTAGKRSTQFQRFCTVLQNFEPFAVGLMQEMGLDPADVSMRRLVTRSFLLATPSRSGSLLMLESLAETEVYAVGKQWLAAHRAGSIAQIEDAR